LKRQPFPDLLTDHRCRCGILRQEKTNRKTLRVLYLTAVLRLFRGSLRAIPPAERNGNVYKRAALSRSFDIWLNVRLVQRL
jgi:hypothetical protein